MILECDTSKEAEEALINTATSKEDIKKKQQCQKRKDHQKQGNYSLHNNVTL